MSKKLTIIFLLLTTFLPVSQAFSDEMILKEKRSTFKYYLKGELQNDKNGTTYEEYDENGNWITYKVDGYYAYYNYRGNKLGFDRIISTYFADNVYDSQNRLITTKRYNDKKELQGIKNFSFDQSGNTIVTNTNSKGDVRSIIKYDADDNIIHERNYIEIKDSTNTSLSESRYRYNDQNQIIQKIYKSIQDQDTVSNSVRDYYYDNNNLKKVTVFRNNKLAEVVIYDYYNKEIIKKEYQYDKFTENKIQHFYWNFNNEYEEYQKKVRYLEYSHGAEYVIVIEYKNKEEDIIEYFAKEELIEKYIIRHNHNGDITAIERVCPNSVERILVQYDYIYW